MNIADAEARAVALRMGLARSRLLFAASTVAQRADQFDDLCLNY